MLRGSRKGTRPLTIKRRSSSPLLAFVAQEQSFFPPPAADNNTSTITHTISHTTKKSVYSLQKMRFITAIVTSLLVAAASATALPNEPRDCNLSLCQATVRHAHHPSHSPLPFPAWFESNVLTYPKCQNGPPSHQGGCCVNG